MGTRGDSSLPIGDGYNSSEKSHSHMSADICKGCRRPFGKDASTTLYVANLPPEWKREDLQRNFEKFGLTKSVNLHKENDTLEPKGFGFVEYNEIAHAAKARYEMNGEEFLGHYIRVNYARNKPWLRKKSGAPPFRYSSPESYSPPKRVPRLHERPRSPPIEFSLESYSPPKREPRLREKPRSAPIQWRAKDYSPPKTEPHLRERPRSPKRLRERPRSPPFRYSSPESYSPPKRVPRLHERPRSPPIEFSRESYSPPKRETRLHEKPRSAPIQWRAKDYSPPKTEPHLRERPRSPKRLRERPRSPPIRYSSSEPYSPPKRLPKKSGSRPIRYCSPESYSPPKRNSNYTSLRITIDTSQRIPTHSRDRSSTSTRGVKRSYSGTPVVVINDRYRPPVDDRYRPPSRSSNRSRSRRTHLRNHTKI